MSSVQGVILGDQNKIKANAPEGSKPQSDIMLEMSDGKKVSMKGKSGWVIWRDNGEWYHLGGGRNRKPTLYRLNGTGWTIKGVDQRIAWSLYEQFGKL